MRRSLSYAMLALVVCLLLTYLPMALTAKRLISAGEYLLFTNAILRATLGHAQEAGGSRALAYTRAALAHSLTTDQIISDTTQVTIPLPPHTIRQPNGAGASRNHYVSFATDAEMIAYITDTMPRSGWSHTDQMGGGHFFTNGVQQIVLTERYLLSTAIREFTIIVDP